MAKKVDPELAVGSPEFVEEFCTKPSFDVDGVQVSSGIGVDGKEYPDPVPMAPPVGYSNPPDLMDMIRTMVKSELGQQAIAEEGWDTEEEAADFDVDDDPLPPITFHEAILMQPPAPATEPAAGEKGSAKAPPTPPSDAGPPMAVGGSEEGVASPPPGSSENPSTST